MKEKLIEEEKRNEHKQEEIYQLKVEKRKQKEEITRL